MYIIYIYTYIYIYYNYIYQQQLTWWTTIGLSTRNNQHRSVMFTNLAIIWGAHLAWRCEKQNTVSWSHVGKKLVWILVRMNSKYLYMEVVKLGVPPNHPSHGRPWPWLSIETTMVTWKFPLSENLHIISMNHSKQQHMARCQHIPFVPERTDLQRNQFSPSGHKYALHVCYICMYIIYIHIMYISIINSCRLHSCIIFLHAHKKKVKALYQ